jgi:hypothetical protein
MTKKKLTAKKAKKILKDNSAQGHKLTGKQKKFFGAIAGGEKPRSKGGKK